MFVVDSRSVRPSVESRCLEHNRGKRIVKTIRFHNPGPVASSTKDPPEINFGIDKGSNPSLSQDESKIKIDHAKLLSWGTWYWSA